ncbi:MAG TPA: SDR family oxidoreductase [Pirellulaceae bacterium]|nr:SDR family oxidoreductase [Pirellulaceae bacterium]HMO91785.1 SDR family oxidoreductase [Pirellulaceae bacterium]HMP69584.1 SDR family oxidoreductase [Pirellulaceae bacterium]
MDLDLKNKRAVVCGSSQGIGKAAAIELALLGAEIVLFARNQAGLEATLDQLDRSAGQQHQIAIADFAHPQDVKQTIQRIVQEGLVHVLVNNTGGPPAGPAIDADIEAFRIAFNNHLICNQLLAQAVVPGMKQSGYGRIINVISTSVKQPIPGLGVSNTIRGAVANWAKTLSMELAAFGITVNNLLPGMTMTGRLQSLIEGRAARQGVSTSEITKHMKDEIPAGRFAEASEIGAVIAFLASPAAAYINGINLPVDGGRTSCL